MRSPERRRLDGGAQAPIRGKAEPEMYQKGQRKGTVRFMLRVDGSPRAVEVAGDFSGWKPLAMKKCPDGTFARDVTVAPGTFEYKFLVDGQWIKDPDHSRWAANGLGDVNSVGQCG